YCGLAALRDLRRGARRRDQSARIGRKGGKARMRQVSSEEQAAYARAGWKALTKKQRAKRAALSWKMRKNAATESKPTTLCRTARPSQVQGGNRTLQCWGACQSDTRSSLYG